jgi:hypothetical protein
LISCRKILSLTARNFRPPRDDELHPVRKVSGETIPVSFRRLGVIRYPYANRVPPFASASRSGVWNGPPVQPITEADVIGENDEDVGPPSSQEAGCAEVESE